MDNTKKQTTKVSGGLKERMQDVYFEILPPVKETKESKSDLKANEQ